MIQLDAVALVFQALVRPKLVRVYGNQCGSMRLSGARSGGDRSPTTVAERPVAAGRDGPLSGRKKHHSHVFVERIRFDRIVMPKASHPAWARLRRSAGKIYAVDRARLLATTPALYPKRAMVMPTPRAQFLGLTTGVAHAVRRQSRMIFISRQWAENSPFLASQR